MSNKKLALVAAISIIAIAFSSFNSYIILFNIGTYEEIQKEIDETNKRIGEVESANSALERQLLLLSEVNTELIEAEVSFQSQLLARNLSQTKENLQQSILGIQSNLAQLVTANSALERQLPLIIEANAESIRGLNQTLFANIAALQGEVSAQSETLARDLAETKEILQEIVIGNQTDLTQLLSDVNNLNSTVSNLMSSLELLDSNLDNLSSNVSKLENRVEELQEQTPENVYESSYKSVVIIRTAIGQGSGFFHSDSNLIVTNWHVVANEEEIEVEFYDRTRSNATIVGTDAYSDVAVIMVSDAPVDAKPLQLGNSSNLHIGQQVVAIGNPLGLSSSLSSGIISQLNKLISLETVPLIVPVIQLDLSIAPGSSGGPLFDLSGNVIGITNAGSGYGFNFAISSNIVKRVAPSLIEVGYYSHPYFGFIAIDLSPETINAHNVLNVEPFQTGLLIVEVEPNMPAAKAGLLPAIMTEVQDGSWGYMARDIIVGIEGYLVIDFKDWWVYISENVSPEQTISLTLWRSGEIISIEITPTFRPQYLG